MDQNGIKGNILPAIVSVVIGSICIKLFGVLPGLLGYFIGFLVKGSVDKKGDSAAAWIAGILAGAGSAFLIQTISVFLLMKYMK